MAEPEQNGGCGTARKKVPGGDNPDQYGKSAELPEKERRNTAPEGRRYVAQEKAISLCFVQRHFQPTVGSIRRLTRHSGDRSCGDYPSLKEGGTKRISSASPIWQSLLPHAGGNFQTAKEILRNKAKLFESHLGASEERPSLEKTFPREMRAPTLTRRRGHAGYVPPRLAV